MAELIFTTSRAATVGAAKRERRVREARQQGWTSDWADVNTSAKRVSPEGMEEPERRRLASAPAWPCSAPAYLVSSSALVSLRVPDSTLTK